MSSARCTAADAGDVAPESMSMATVVTRIDRMIFIWPNCLNAVGAENRVTSCGLHVLVDESAEPISSQRPDRGTGGWGSAALGWLLVERSVGPV